MPKIETHYSVKQLAERLGISTEAAYDLIAHRLIAHFRVGGLIKISETDLQDFLKRNRVAAINE